METVIAIYFFGWGGHCDFGESNLALTCTIDGKGIFYAIFA